LRNGRELQEDAPEAVAQDRERFTRP
jgi:hypothetical protein